MNNWFSIIFVLFGLLSLQACKETSKQNQKNQQIFDLASYVDEYKKNNPSFKNARLISRTGEVMDTIYFSDYNADSITRIIKQFDFSLRDRSKLFQINQSQSDKFICKEFKPQFDCDINYLTVCTVEDVVSSLSGSKGSKSLLSIFDQQYYFDPKGSFELSSILIDKMKKDTLVTLNTLTWGDDK